MKTTSLTLLEQLRSPVPGQAWSRFVSLYTPLLLHWASRQGLQPADAADLTQDVLLKLLGLLPTYQRGAGQTFRGWLLRVVANQCQDFRRRRATRALPRAEGLSDVTLDQADGSLEETEYRRLLVARGLELIRQDFAEPTWKAFHGVMLDGKSAATVASELGLSENAVYLARHRVLTRLRQELEGLLD